ncbi:MAG: Terminase-like family protein [candidate division TA06 bacterium ADurb.Bin131]|uniref:Terminase-like family protein n=1 Tax=candidate division TA06 bacterium ADurb.Bin131 TaxID=1852827 RepID=A0A1V6CF07_UNCT6|nr:MAG: Terminase-like family protein [candidate division TA06 bacterium ADurb.Bin131]
MNEEAVIDIEAFDKQIEILNSPAKRKIIRAGRRAGKTVLSAILAAKKFSNGGRVLYAAPTQEQTERFWHTVRILLQGLIDAGLVVKNETLKTIERVRTEQRIKAKTAWNSDTLRGDYCDLLILDEMQLIDEMAWEEVGQPMLIDNDGDAVLIYTPPSHRSRSMSKARDKTYMAKLFKKAQADTTGRWKAFHFTSFDNPFISRTAIDEISKDMTSVSYKQEIMAEDIEDIPGALWKRKWFDEFRKDEIPELAKIVVAIDPATTSKATSDEVGIVCAGAGIDGRYYVLADRSGIMSPDAWGNRAINLYKEFNADRIIAEVNNGGDLVETVLRTIEPNIPYTAVVASRGKITRAEPVAAMYEQGKVSHIGNFEELETQCAEYIPGDKSPDRMDALVWAITYLMENSGKIKYFVDTI